MQEESLDAPGEGLDVPGLHGEAESDPPAQLKMCNNQDFRLKSNHE